MITNVGISGIQEAQDANLRHIASLQPNGSFGKAVQYATMEAHRYAVAITHVDTGALRGAHTMDVSGLRGKLYVRAETNPKTFELTSKYAAEEHARGGSHAFYARTYNEAGRSIAEAAGHGYAKGLR